MDFPSRPEPDGNQHAPSSPPDSDERRRAPSPSAPGAEGGEVDPARIARGASLDRAALDRLEEFHASIVRLRRERDDLIGDFRALTRPARSGDRGAPEGAASGAEPEARGSSSSPSSTARQAPTILQPTPDTMLGREAGHGPAVAAPSDDVTPPHGDELAVALTERLRNQGVERAVLAGEATPARSSRMIRLGGLAAAAVVVLAFLLIRTGRAPRDLASGPASTTASAEPTTAGPAPIAPPRPATTPGDAASAADAKGTTGEVSPATGGIRVELVTLRPVWIRAVVDGRRAIEALTPADRTIVLDARAAVLLRFGDAGAVRVHVNGVDEGLAGRDGQVVDRRFVVPQGGAETAPKP